MAKSTRTVSAPTAADVRAFFRADEKRITDVLRAEEERFFETLANGMEILDAALGLSEETGLIGELGAVILRGAVRRA